MSVTNYITMFNINKREFKDSRHFVCSSGYPFVGIGILIAGSAVFTAQNGIKAELCPGEAIYIPKGQIYVSDWTGSPDIIFYSISLDYQQNRTGAHYYPLQKFTADPNIISETEQMYHMLADGTNGKYHALGRFYTIYPEIIKKLSRARYNANYLEIMRAVTYIEQNCTSDFSVSSLAKMCNMSESKFYAAFKSGTGYSPTEYKNHVRIMRAEQMLTQNSCSIEYLCEQLNFCSPAYFRRVFKQHTNMLPSQLKNKNTTL